MVIKLLYYCLYPYEYDSYYSCDGYDSYYDYCDYYDYYAQTYTSGYKHYITLNTPLALNACKGMNYEQHNNSYRVLYIFIYRYRLHYTVLHSSSTPLKEAIVL